MENEAAGTMSMIRNAAQPMWQAESWGFSGKAERHVRDLSHASVLVFAAAAVAAGILASVSLSSEIGIGASESLMVVAILFPLLCGCLVREHWRARKLEGVVNGLEADIESVNSLSLDADTPVGLLVLSPDLKICFANYAFLQGALKKPREVLGRKLRDVMTAEGIADQAETLLARSDPAASCCFDTFIAGLAGERRVHVTMARIAPRHGEDRVLVVVEDMLRDSSAFADLRVEGYIC